MAEIYDWEQEGSLIYNWEQARRSERNSLLIGSGVHRFAGNALCVASIVLATKADIGFLQTANDVQQSGQLDNLVDLAAATFFAWGGFGFRSGSRELQRQANELV